MNLLKGALVGGLILFAFQAISWMALPFHEASVQGFPDEAAIKQAIAGVKQNTILVLPDPKKMDQNAAPPPGPMVFASVSPGGMNAMGPAMGVQFLVQVVCALFGTWLLLQTRGLGYGTKVCFFTTVGVIIGLSGHVENTLWWGFPWSYTFAQIVDPVVGWLLAGLVVAKIVKTRA